MILGEYYRAEVRGVNSGLNANVELKKGKERSAFNLFLSASKMDVPKQNTILLTVMKMG